MDADTMLKIWAVVGPLLAAAASAVWSRRVQLVDRQHADSRDDAKLDREERSRHQERIQLHSKQQYDEAKTAISRFMSSSHIFVRRQTDLLNNLTNPEIKNAASLANEEFTHYGQLVVLIADDDLENATIELWNAAIALPRPASEANGPNYLATLAEYKQLRAKFNMHAKRFLATLSSAEA